MRLGIKNFRSLGVLRIGHVESSNRPINSILISSHECTNPIPRPTTIAVATL